MKNILILEDDLELLKLYSELINLKYPGNKIFNASEIKTAQDTLKNEHIDIFICDGRVHSETPNTFPLLKETKEKFPHMIIIVWSGNIDFAIEMNRILKIPFSEKIALLKKLQEYF